MRKTNNAKKNYIPPPVCLVKTSVIVYRTPQSMAYPVS